MINGIIDNAVVLGYVLELYGPGHLILIILV